MNFFSRLGRETLLSPVFCHETEESTSHLFSSALWYNLFGNQFSLFGNEAISEVGVIFGIARPLENSVLYNNLILISKQYIYI